ncbi:hypothetical protein ABEO98_22690 [Brevibacillus parabrevis]|uniref:hypothetical protein n=1 Tax=Brevibacillus parabrevis TaxID=54914 RepID=UPI003D2341B8
MIRYFKVLAGTREWELFNKLWTYQDKWIELTPQIEKLLGCNIDKNLATNSRDLYLANPPKHLKEQFTKNPDKEGFHRAKSNSNIRKQWLDFVKAYGLNDYNISRLIWDLHIPTSDMNAIRTAYPMMKGDYYIDLRESNTWKGYEWAVEVDEPTFLRVRADWLEGRNKRTD